MQEPVFRPVSSASSSFTGQELESTGPTAQTISSVSQTGQGTMDTSYSAQYNMAPIIATSSDFAGAMTYPEQEYRDPPEHPVSDEDNPLAEEGEVSSDNLERQEQTEDMTFRETVRSVRSFMG